MILRPFILYSVVLGVSDCLVTVRFGTLTLFSLGLGVFAEDEPKKVVPQTHDHISVNS